MFFLDSGHRMWHNKYVLNIRIHIRYQRFMIAPTIKKRFLFLSI